MSQSNDEDVPQLSLETLKALQEFYNERAEKETNLAVSLSNNYENVVFDEDWQLSQFWYDDYTVEVLTKVACKVLQHSDKVALISCPTLYKSIKQRHKEVILLEYDERFAAYGSDYISYDYNSPLNIREDLEKDCNLVIADPPFISSECLTKTSETIKFLAKDKIILCTGAIMAPLIEQLLDLKPCSFEPKHRNNLANEFACYTNFDFDSYL